MIYNTQEHTLNPCQPEPQNGPAGGTAISAQWSPVASTLLRVYDYYLLHNEVAQSISSARNSKPNATDVLRDFADCSALPCVVRCGMDMIDVRRVSYLHGLNAEGRPPAR